MATPTGGAPPNPQIIYHALNAYQNTAALRAAIELDIFTGIGEGDDTVSALARRCRATERGIRILCDYLVIIGFLTKHDQRYGLTLESAAFLDRRSPTSMASTAGYLTLPQVVAGFMQLADVIRTGEPPSGGQGSVSPENPVWVEFARSMAPMMRAPAEGIAKAIDAAAGKKWKVLDLAAGHGAYGITIAKHNANAEIYAQDWAPVLEVALENARAAGVESRVHRVPGSAFDADLGSGYDVILVTNFLHHFDPATNETLLRRLRAALAAGGLVVTLDFIPNEDRVTPVRSAGFAMTMLGTTRHGDAFTASEYRRMFENAGFAQNEFRSLPTGHTLILSRV
jgi:2-polyprenyl-3-methyl-5-hydroxy-6-metoxy-1,4-benzoquinol methylase